MLNDLYNIRIRMTDIFLSISYKLGMELNALHTLSCSILSIIQHNGGYFYPCFTNGEAKTRRPSNPPLVTQRISTRAWIRTQNPCTTQPEGISSPEMCLSKVVCSCHGTLCWVSQISRDFA